MSVEIRTPFEYIIGFSEYAFWQDEKEKKEMPKGLSNEIMSIAWQSIIFLICSHATTSLLNRKCCQLTEISRLADEVYKILQNLKMKKGGRTKCDSSIR